MDPGHCGCMSLVASGSGVVSCEATLVVSRWLTVGVSCPTTLPSSVGSVGMRSQSAAWALCFACGRTLTCTPLSHWMDALDFHRRQLTWPRRCPSPPHSLSLCCIRQQTEWRLSEKYPRPFEVLVELICGLKRSWKSMIKSKQMTSS